MYHRLQRRLGTTRRKGIIFHGGLAQLARAPALQAGGQRFESVILHKSENIRIGKVSIANDSQSLKILHYKEIIDILENNKAKRKTGVTL